METTTVERAEQKLIRVVGRKEIIALTINGIVGGAIFILPATVATILGIAGPLAFFCAGLLSVFIVLCFAELGGRYDRTGGAYLYASEAFGGVGAFLIGWFYFLARIDFNRSFNQCLHRVHQLTFMNCIPLCANNHPGLY